MNELDFDPGSICDGCPHALDDHDLKFTEGAGVLLTCERCPCLQTWGKPSRPLRDVSFNQEAQEALGSPAREQGESE